MPGTISQLPSCFLLPRPHGLHIPSLSWHTPHSPQAMSLALRSEPLLSVEEERCEADHGEAQ